MEVKINEEIVGKLKERVESTDEFNDIEEYVNYILEQIVEKLKNEEKLKEEDEEEPTPSENTNNELPADKEKAKQVLRDLGYLD